MLVFSSLLVACAEEDEAKFEFSPSASLLADQSKLSDSKAAQCLERSFFPFQLNASTLVNAGEKGLIIRLNEKYARAIDQDGITFRQRMYDDARRPCLGLNQLEGTTQEVDDKSCLQLNFFSYDCMGGALSLHLDGAADIIRARFGKYQRIHVVFRGTLVRKMKRVSNPSQFDVSELGEVNGFFNIAVRPGTIQQDFTQPL